MWRSILVSAIAAALGLASGPARAAEDLFTQVKKACGTELNTICKGITPGKGHAVACLYAYEDKVSDHCAVTMYRAVAELQQAVATLKYAATECREDLEKYCGDVQPGQGRGLACIEKNEAGVSQRCKDAMKKTGLKK